MLLWNTNEDNTGKNTLKAVIYDFINVWALLGRKEAFSFQCSLVVEAEYQVIRLKVQNRALSGLGMEGWITAHKRFAHRLTPIVECLTETLGVLIGRKTWANIHPLQK